MLNPGTITLSISQFPLLSVGLRATKTRTEDYNRAKFALNLSFVGLLLQVILSDKKAGFGHCCNKNKNIYNIKSIGAKFLSIVVVCKAVHLLLFLLSLLHEINH